MRVILARHGHYSGNDPLPNGQAPDEVWYQSMRRAGLSDIGKTQAQDLAARLTNTRIDAIYSSPMPRAVETAARVSEVTGVPIEVWDELQELSPLSYPGAPADYCCDEENNYRVTRSVEERLWGIHGTDQNVLLVTHGAFISTFLSSVLRLLPLFVPSKRRRSCCEHYCAGASQS